MTKPMTLKNGNTTAMLLDRMAQEQSGAAKPLRKPQSGDLRRNTNGTVERWAKQGDGYGWLYWDDVLGNDYSSTPSMFDYE